MVSTLAKLLLVLLQLLQLPPQLLIYLADVWQPLQRLAVPLRHNRGEASSQAIE